VTSIQLNGLVGTLWLLVIAMVAFLAFNAPHFSPWEFVIPTSDPWSWISPTLIATPPTYLVAAALAPANNLKPLGIALVVLLAVASAAIAIFLIGALS
jgi:hypothetical protein